MGQANGLAVHLRLFLRVLSQRHHKGFGQQVAEELSPVPAHRRAQAVSRAVLEGPEADFDDVAQLVVLEGLFGGERQIRADGKAPGSVLVLIEPLLMRKPPLNRSLVRPLKLYVALRDVVLYLAVLGKHFVGRVIGIGIEFSDELINLLSLAHVELGGKKRIAVNIGRYIADLAARAADLVRLLDDVPLNACEQRGAAHQVFLGRARSVGQDELAQIASACDSPSHHKRSLLVDEEALVEVAVVSAVGGKADF